MQCSSLHGYGSEGPPHHQGGVTIKRLKSARFRFNVLIVQTWKSNTLLHAFTSQRTRENRSAAIRAAAHACERRVRNIPTPPTPLECCGQDGHAPSPSQASSRLDKILSYCKTTFFALAFAFTAENSPGQAPQPKAEPSRYEQRQEHDPDGIGKFYLGREIAHVMGHQAADWLERPEREAEEKPDLLLQSLKLKPGDAVADIGAGTGYLSWRMAKQVGEKGVVYAVDIQQEMLDLLAQKMAGRKVTNVKPVLGAITDPKLPINAVDLVIMVDVYHEFSHPFEMMQAIGKSLKPGGRVVFVEYRAEDPGVPIKRVHKMSEAQVRKEAAVHSLQWVETIGVLPRQHIIIFKKTR